MPCKPKQDAIQIDSQKFKEWCAKTGKSFKQVSEELGRYDCFVSRYVSMGEFPARSMELLCRMYGLPKDTFVKKGPTLKKDEPTGEYSMSLDVRPDKVKVGIYYKNELLYSAYAATKGNSEVNLIQAISYAAHMCYKMAEQKSFHEN